MSDLSYLLQSNRDLLNRKTEVRKDYRLDPQRYKPYLLRPCRVRILLVADDFIYFSDENFGLSDLLAILAVPPGPYVRFELTCAHRNNVSDARAGIGNPVVTRSIKNFRFDNTGHFATDMYEEVWLFGSEVSYEFNGQWTNKPSNDELRALTDFMDDGRGVFATGDHGALGAALCGHVPRVRSMRQWFAQPGPFGEPAAPDMNSAQRNDTNRVGHGSGFEFDDQSDDIPQPIDWTPYSRRINVFKNAVFPHPLLCGPNGPIDVLPDHPHEGECITAYELDREFDLDGPEPVVEYPPGVGGEPPPEPEVIATSTVIGGNNVKEVAAAQSFGAIGVYDGEVAGVGRVAVDATWHHFININLTGDTEVDAGDPKAIGFLASPAGQAHFENIKAYFRNIALWLAPATRRACMRRGGIWLALWEQRLIEAVTPGLPLYLDSVSIRDLLYVGRHARDAIGKYAGQCQSIEWTIDILRPILDIEWVEKWRPWPPPEPDPFKGRIRGPEPDPVPWFDDDPIVDLALGGAVIALREAFPSPNDVDPEKAEEAIPRIIEEGARRGIAAGLESLQVARDRMEALAQRIEGVGGREEPTSS